MNREVFKVHEMPLRSNDIYPNNFQPKENNKLLKHNIILILFTTTLNKQLYKNSLKSHSWAGTSS